MIMMTEMQDDRTGAHYWLARGRGPLRQIVAEGSTRAEARKYWLQQYHTQREEKAIQGGGSAV